MRLSAVPEPVMEELGWSSRDAHPPPPLSTAPAWLPLPVCSGVALVEPPPALTLGQKSSGSTRRLISRKQIFQEDCPGTGSLWFPAGQRAGAQGVQHLGCLCAEGRGTHLGTWLPRPHPGPWELLEVWVRRRGRGRRGPARFGAACTPSAWQPIQTPQEWGTEGTGLLPGFATSSLLALCSRPV